MLAAHIWPMLLPITKFNQHAPYGLGDMLRKRNDTDFAE